jgi:hypothetical protein
MQKRTSGPDSIATQVNLRLRRKISPDTIIGILRGEADASPWLMHIHSMLLDVHVASLVRFFAEHDISLDYVRGLCVLMPETDRTEALRRVDAIQKATIDLVHF